MSAAGRPALPALLGGMLIAGAFTAASLPNLRYASADNGDFTRFVGDRIVKPRGFAADWPAAADPAFARRFYGCWHRFWEYRPVVDPALAPADAGATRLLWLLAFALDRAVTSDGFFDLYVLSAAVRAACLLALLLYYAIAVRHFRGRSRLLPILLAAPLAAALSDLRYTSFFATFYRESGTLLFALLTVCGLLLLPGRRFAAAAALTTAAAALLAGSATHHFFTGLLAAAALVAAFLRWRRRAGERARGAAAWAGLAAAVALLAGIAVLSVQRPAEFRAINAYHALFLGALVVSDDPGPHLTALGLPPAARRLVGTHAFTPEGAAFRSAHPEVLRHGKIAAALLREPPLLPRLLRRSAAQMTDPAAALWFVHHASCDGRRPRPGAWTAARGLLSGGTVLLFLAAAAAAGLAALRSADPRFFAVGLALAFAALCALGDLTVQVAGDGFMELTRHLFAANLFFDLALALALWLGALAWARRRERTAP